jgi:hypothetical protein
MGAKTPFPLLAHFFLHALGIISRFGLFPHAGSQYHCCKNYVTVVKKIKHNIFSVYSILKITTSFATLFYKFIKTRDL